MWSLIIIDVSDDRFQSAHSTAPAEDYLLSLGITGRTNYEDFSHLRPNFKLQDAFALAWRPMFIPGCKDAGAKTKEAAQLVCSQNDHFQGQVQAVTSPSMRHPVCPVLDSSVGMNIIVKSFSCFVTFLTSTTKSLRAETKTPFLWAPKGPAQGLALSRAE